jgi:hypothetical protein
MQKKIIKNTLHTIDGRLQNKTTAFGSFRFLGFLGRCPPVDLSYKIVKYLKKKKTQKRKQKIQLLIKKTIQN